MRRIIILFVLLFVLFSVTTASATPQFVIALRIYNCDAPNCPRIKSGNFTPAYQGYAGTYITTIDGKYLQKTTLGWSYWTCDQPGGGSMYPGYLAYAGNGTTWSFQRNSLCYGFSNVSVWEYINWP